MKKTLVILNLVLLSLFISGCGCSKKEKVTNCELISDNYEVKIIFTSDENGKILNFERTEKFNNYEKDRKENYHSFLTNMKNWATSIENYDYEYNIEEDYISSKLSIDFSKVDYNEVLNAPGLYTKYFDYDKKYFDINLAIKAYKNDEDYKGLVCK